ncbi:MAG TPA: trehalose-phosphatase [Xanthobacteraceae bacterium]|nr:trehalose-phosphatase [Xanthobacteraceae bacterium]
MKVSSIDISKTAILLDIDGTLLDIAPTPDAVHVPATLRKTLGLLQQRAEGALALVSGRPLRSIDLLFAPLRLAAVGGHGAEIRVDPNAPICGRVTPLLEPEIRKLLVAIGDKLPGIIVEDKDYSIALHYRTVPYKQEAVEDAVAAVYGDLSPDSVEVLHGKRVIEVKKAGFNKGTAIRDLMTHPPFANRKPIFIGDDQTDEAAFAVMPDYDGVAISVGRQVRGVAEYFEAPSDVRRWLRDLAEGHAIRA